MSFVFVSHAAPDKLQRVKPLVHALALEGAKLWLDRPGVGDSHFNFDEAFLTRYGIQGLRAGPNWDDSIVEALRASSAVLLCLSHAAVEPKREVLRNEMIIGWYERKIVPCFVDDLPFDKVPADLGLPDLTRQQAERVKPTALQRCLDWLAAAPGRSADQLPTQLAPYWQQVRKLRDDLAAVEQRAAQGRRPSGPSEAAQALHALLSAAPRPMALLLRLYRRSLPDLARAIPAPALSALLRHLDDLSPREPQLPPPLVEFAERLLREADDAALRDWLAQHTAADRTAYLELQRRLDGPSRTRTRATLFVDVDPDVGQQMRWWIHAADPAYCSAEHTLPLTGEVPQALADCLGQCLAEAEATIGGNCRISVALLLPKKLLAVGLESLSVPMRDDEESPAVPVALQRRYPVTLHWLLAPTGN